MLQKKSVHSYLKDIVIQLHTQVDMKNRTPQKGESFVLFISLSNLGLGSVLGSGFGSGLGQGWVRVGFKVRVS